MSDDDEPATRCVISGRTVSHVPEKVWRESKGRLACIGCGHEVTFSVWSQHDVGEVRIAPHRTDGTPCR